MDELELSVSTRIDSHCATAQIDVRPVVSDLRPEHPMPVAFLWQKNLKVHVALHHARAVVFRDVYGGLRLVSGESQRRSFKRLSVA